MNILRNALLAASVAGTCSAFAQPIAEPGTEGFSVLAGGGDIVATYLGTTAAYSDDLLFNGAFVFNNQSSPTGSTYDLGTFAAGTELIFELRVNNTGNDWYTGPASRNADGVPHARVQSDYLMAGTTLVSFEDLAGDPEGASGFNDLSFSFTNTAGSPTPAAPVPEAQTYALMAMGLGVLPWVARRRRS